MQTHGSGKFESIFLPTAFFFYIQHYKLLHDLTNNLLSGQTTKTKNSEKKTFPPWSLSESPCLHLDNFTGGSGWGATERPKSQPQAECLYWHMHLSTVSSTAFNFTTLLFMMNTCKVCYLFHKKYYKKCYHLDTRQQRWEQDTNPKRKDL